MSILSEHKLDYPFDPDLLLRKRKAIKRELLEQDIKWLDKKIAILGGSTTNDIRDFIEIFLLKEGIRPVFYESEYNKYWEDAMFGNPELDEFKPDIVFIHTSHHNIKNWPVISMKSSEIDQILKDEFENFKMMWEKLEQRFECPIVQNNFDRPSYRLLGNKDISDEHGRSNFVYRLNGLFYEYASHHPNFFIHDIDYLSAQYGIGKWQDEQYWTRYKYAFALRAVPEFAYSLTRIIKSVYGKNKKVLALDLDNTLWGGVVGDDGVDNLEIGPETALAEAHLGFQKYLAQIRELGVLLTVNSKNDEENAIAGLKHPNNALHPEDFALIKANWFSKDENILSTAKELNLGVDSIVFIDDNPAERNIVRSQLPVVSVPEVEQPEYFINAIDRAGYFEVTSLTADDLQRNEMYKANAARLEVQKSFADYGEYLRSLEMQAEIGDFTPVNIQRVAQLTNKTNQFNLTTKRYSEADITAISADDSYIRLCGSLKDKFGDNGIVSIVLGKIDGEAIDIELWLMSCRVLKRDFELAMFDKLIEECKKKGVKTLRGFYYPTAKNGMVKDFYSGLGFSKVSEENGNTEWLYEIDSHVKKNNIISII